PSRSSSYLYEILSPLNFVTLVVHYLLYYSLSLSPFLFIIYSLFPIVLSYIFILTSFYTLFTNFLIIKKEYPLDTLLYSTFMQSLYFSSSFCCLTFFILSTYFSKILFIHCSI